MYVTTGIGLECEDYDKELKAHDIGCAGKLRLSGGFRRHVCQVTFKKGAMWILAAGGVSWVQWWPKLNYIYSVD